MLNLTLEQQTEVARIVTQQPWKYLHGHVILDGDEKLHYWNPSLTGEDWQLAQACRVIVAALRCQSEVGLVREATVNTERFRFILFEGRIIYNNDLLTAAALALLGDKT